MLGNKEPDIVPGQGEILRTEQDAECLYLLDTFDLVVRELGRATCVSFWKSAEFGTVLRGTLQQHEHPNMNARFKVWRDAEGELPKVALNYEGDDIDP